MSGTNNVRRIREYWNNERSYNPVSEITALDDIETLLDEIERLESELEATRKWGTGWQKQFDEAQSKNKILREALQPFSDFYAAFPISYVVDGDEIVIFGFNDTALRIRHFLNTVE